MSRHASLVVLALIPLLGGCGPSEREIGHMVLGAFPFITIAACLFAHACTKMWQAIGAKVSFHYGPSFKVAAAQLVLWLSIVPSDTWDFAYVFLAFCLAGLSFLTLQLVTMRVAVHVASRNQASDAPKLNLGVWCLWPALFFYTPAIGLGVFGQTGVESKTWLAFYFFPGYSGILTGGLAAVLTLEWGIRYRRLRQQRVAERLPRPLPVARSLRR